MIAKILFVISDLEAGGAQRVSIRLIDRWERLGSSVVLVTVADSSSDFFAAPGSVGRVVLDRPNQRRGLHAALLNNWDRSRRLRRVVRGSSPDIVISFLDRTNVLVLCSLLGTGVPVIVSERIDPRHHSVGTIWRVLRRFAYRRAASIVVQTSSVATWAQGRFGRVWIDVIPNPVSIELGSGTTGTSLPSPYVVGVGRLIPQKGFDLLIDAFGQLADRRPEWHLVVAGEGEQRSDLERRAQRLGIRDRVHLVGRVHDIAPVVSGASIFVLSSRFEGFPNALLEAMALGVPSIAAACPSGPDEIISSGLDGVLVAAGSVDELEAALEMLMDDPAKRDALGAAASATVARRYSMDRVGDAWDRLIDDTRCPR